MIRDTIIIILCVSFIIGCKSKNRFDALIGQKIEINYDSLHDYNNYVDLNNYNDMLKIITCLQMDCPSCVESIYEWDQLMKEFNSHEVQLIVILRGEDSEYTYHHLVENNNFDFPILWDPHNSFMKKNKLHILEFKKSILIDNKNQIVLIGSPLNNSSLYRKYRKKTKVTNKQ